MKNLIVTAAFLAASVANAATITRLIPPASLPVPYRANVQCVGASFNAKDSIAGSCVVSYAYPCSGWGCHPIRYTDVYIEGWLAGVIIPIAPIHCVSISSQYPQSAQYTYDAGFNASNCRVPSLWTPTKIIANGAPYYYVTTAADGSAQIVNSNTASYALMP